MKPWTVMIFLAGDNDLEWNAHIDLIEMKRAGRSDEVNVVVELDSREEGTHRYDLHSGELKAAGDPLPETNAGDPAVLADFIRWARANYPAERELLVIWNHGTGWEDIAADFNWGNIRAAAGRATLRRSLFRSTITAAREAVKNQRAIALDASSRDYLDNRELQQALVAALQDRPLDVLGMDACLMACVEVAYQLRDQAHYLVASQENQPGSGWPYDRILRALYAKPAMSGRELATTIVEAYAEAGSAMRTATKYTQSALDLGQVAETHTLIQVLSDHLAGYPEGHLLLRRAVDAASRRKRGAKRFQDQNLVDFYDWLWHFRRNYTGDDEALTGTVERLLTHLRGGEDKGLIVASSAVVGDDTAQIHGLSIYLPRHRQYNALYEELDFAGSGWPSFARAVSENVK